MTLFKPVFSFLFICLYVVLLAGCASAEKQRHLDYTLIKYEKSLRWATLDDASTYQKEPEEITSAERKRMKSIKVTGYRIISSKATEEAYSRLVEIFYYNESTAVERSLTVREDWIYDDDKSIWLLASKLPRFR